VLVLVAYLAIARPDIQSSAQTSAEDIDHRH
jgi:hypothetical protein